MLNDRTGPASPVPVARLAALAVGVAVSASSAAQTPATGANEAAPSTTAASSLDALGWLRGCWLGSVNRREFREQWSPPRGGMMVGFSHTVIGPRLQGTLREKMDVVGKPSTDHSQDKTQDYEYLRLEQRPDGVYYVAVPSGKREVSFRLNEVKDESGGKAFIFTNLVDEFPQRIVYRRGTEGWLYAQVTGKEGVSGSDIVYPMQHIDCATDALLKE